MNDVIARQFSWQNFSDRVGRVVMVLLGSLVVLDGPPTEWKQILGVLIAVGGAIWTGKNGGK